MRESHRAGTRHLRREVGTALLTIRDQRLYRESHKTFEDYCRERWGFSRVRAHQLIEASEVAGLLTTVNEPLPSSERQARELVPLKDEPEVMAKVWVEVLEETNGKPTAAAIHKVVAEHARVVVVGSITTEKVRQHVESVVRLLGAANKHMDAVGRLMDRSGYASWSHREGAYRAALDGLQLEKLEDTLSTGMSSVATLAFLFHNVLQPTCDTPEHRSRRKDVQVAREVIDGVDYDFARCPECRKGGRDLPYLQPEVRRPQAARLEGVLTPCR